MTTHPMDHVKFGSEVFARIRDLHGEAERIIRRVEIQTWRTSIPAINEFRHAEDHLLKSLASGDSRTLEGELRKAESHCQRAMYEALEAGILYLLERVQEFADDYRDIPITPVLPDYHGVQALATKVQRQLSEGRANRALPEDQLQQYMDSFHELVDNVETLEVSRSNLNEVKFRLVERDRRYVLATLLAALGIMIAVHLGIS